MFVRESDLSGQSAAPRPTPALAPSPSRSRCPSFRVGAVYNPAIARFSTNARTFSYHRFAGIALGSDKERNLTGEVMLGLGLRMQSRFLIDLFGRYYSQQNDDRSYQVAVGVGANSRSP